MPKPCLTRLIFPNLAMQQDTVNAKRDCCILGWNPEKKALPEQKQRVYIPFPARLGGNPLLFTDHRSAS